MRIPINDPTLDHQVDNYLDIIPLIDKYFVQMEPIKLSAREFCRKIYRLSDLPEVEILRAEIEPQYRKYCINILSKTLDVSRQSILNWRRGLDFPYMPDHHQRFLGLYWERYELFMENKNLRRIN